MIKLTHPLGLWNDHYQTDYWWNWTICPMTYNLYHWQDKVWMQYQPTTLWQTYVLTRQYSQSSNMSTTSYTRTYHTQYTNSSAHHPASSTSAKSSQHPSATHSSNHCPSPPLGQHPVAQHSAPYKPLHPAQNPWTGMHSDHSQQCISKSLQARHASMDHPLMHQTMVWQRHCS